VAGNDIYGGTYRLFEQVFAKWGIKVSYADVDAPASFAQALRRNTRLIWVETPTNPLLKIVDIGKLATIAKRSGALLAVDNTFASPYFQKPLELGADLVVHSTTKYLAGHSDVIGGAVVCDKKLVYEKLKFHQNAAGAVPGPWDCWLVLRGIKTLAVRMREHEANALCVARYLRRHRKVSRVYYPGLPDHAGYRLARRQMTGFGGMLSVEFKGGRKAVDRFFSRLKVFCLAESLGGVESLACYPALMTHGSIPKGERLRRGISDGLVRLSVGIENKDDLLEDLARALA
jgi:cystathionine gamma-synthase/cystathionine gamma-lyase